jgi:hypothetical protein
VYVLKNKTRKSSKDVVAINWLQAARTFMLPADAVCVVLFRVVRFV